MKGKDDITYAWSTSLRNDVVSHLTEVHFHIKERMHWILAISIIVFTFVLTNFQTFQINTYSKVGSYILLVGLFSIIFILLKSISSISLFGFKKSKEPRSSLFSYQKILNYPLDDLKNVLGDSRRDSSKLDKIFAETMIDESKRIQESTSILKLVGKILLFTLLVGSILLIIGFLLGGQGISFVSSAAGH